MPKLVPEQVKWLIKNQPNIENKCKYLDYKAIKRSEFNSGDYSDYTNKACVLWISKKIYDSLPDEFKALQT